MLNFKNLKQLEQTLNTQEKCLEYYESIRFEEGYFCPHCNSTHYYKLSKPYTYKCANKECAKRFNVLTGTIFENTKICLSSWFTAIYIATTNKKGISSTTLAEYLGVTQKTSWFMLHRIREGMRDKEKTMLSNEVEIDETFVGGNKRFMHKSRIDKIGTAPGYLHQNPVMGMLERNGKLIVKVISEAKGEILKPIIREHISKEATLMTDGFGGYSNLKKEYKGHGIIFHEKEFVRGNIHTQNIDSFWSHLKRSIFGVYHQVSKKHLHRYCDENAFRYNTRHIDSSMRFDETLRNGQTRLTYANLIQKVA